MDVTGNTEKSTPLNPEVFEERWRKIRLTGMVLAAAAAASLAVAMVVDPVPLLFLVLAAALGAAYGLSLSWSRGSMPGIGSGLLAGMLIVAFFKVRDLLFPGIGDDFFAHVWPGGSAWMLGLAAAAIPLVRRNLLRKLPELRADSDTITRLRNRGDSAFVAQLRLSAGKTPTGYIIVLIGIAAIMGGLGLYVLLFEDGLIGLLLAAMCALPIAFFAWMLKLKRRS